MGSDTPVLVLCNGASSPDESSGNQGALVLDYRDGGDGVVNVKLGLPNFDSLVTSHGRGYWK